MIHLLNPRNSNFKERRATENFAVACSGGYDSMAALHFFARGGWKPLVIHVDHNTGNSKAITPIMEVVEKFGLEIQCFTIDPDAKQADVSWEEFWRDQRMAIFNFKGMPPVVTGHNLNDAMETWLFSSINGQSKLIPYNTGNVYRPFLLTKKSELLDYVTTKNVPWFNDQSNDNVKYVRNRIRHNILPEVLEVNRGFDTTIRNKYLEKYRD